MKEFEIVGLLFLVHLILFFSCDKNKIFEIKKIEKEYYQSEYKWVGSPKQRSLIDSFIINKIVIMNYKTKNHKDQWDDIFDDVYLELYRYGVRLYCSRKIVYFYQIKDEHKNIKYLDYKKSNMDSLDVIMDKMY